ncbi:hypothetical protein, partial [Aliagarivorans taiwanensis]|uniref:hypothetical protein n=1 Tax=Aliagarivorans taiwanensis TaxID=561966 RepID=UPI001B7FB1CD
PLLNISFHFVPRGETASPVLADPPARIASLLSHLRPIFADILAEPRMVLDFTLICFASITIAVKMESVIGSDHRQFPWLIPFDYCFTTTQW